MVNPMDLTGKHIIVTGASDGIGQSACIQASKLGAHISMIARNEEKLKQTISLVEGNNHNYYVFDLNETDNIGKLVKDIVKERGNIDGLVHCAGISKNYPIKILKTEYAETMMRIHYLAFLELIRNASGRNMSNPGASYVGVSSAAAFRAQKSQSAYAAAKGAMVSAIRPLAKELAVKEIRINTIAYGMVDTKMYYQDYLEIGASEDELLQRQYMGIIDREHAGLAICFLLSDISKYMTGTTLLYDAGTLT